MPSLESPHDQLPPFPAIPYGRAYFKGIRLEGCLYVDKTRFLRPLEQERFGKTSEHPLTGGCGVVGGADPTVDSDWMSCGFSGSASARLLTRA